MVPGQLLKQRNIPAVYDKLPGLITLLVELMFRRQATASNSRTRVRAHQQILDYRSWQFNRVSVD
jgi:hypothetical protein